jgi:hypothetical protein
MRSFQNFTGISTVIEVSHVARSVSVFALGDALTHSKWRHPRVRLCAVQRVPTAFFMSTTFFE